MKRTIISLLVCVLASCSRQGGDYVDGIIVFDNATNYPELDLRLSDVADVTYIPLKGMDEGFFIDKRVRKSNDVFIYGGEIYLRQEKTGVHVFDMSGNPLRRLDRRGRGPGEYGPYILNSWFEPETNSVYVAGLSHEIFEYDAKTFEFRRSSGLIGFGFIPAIYPLNRDYLIVENKYQHGIFAGSTIPFYLLSPSNWEMRPMSITLEEPYIHDLDGLSDHSPVIPADGGTFICNVRCDTILWMDRKTMEIKPRMIDKSQYPGDDIMAIPSFETDRYVFFSHIFTPYIYPSMEMRAFVFDKRKEKIFRLPQVEDWRNILVPLAITRDECWLTTWNTTYNEDYGAQLFQAMDLIDNIEVLPPDLKKIAATLKENDNPVLALIKFR